VYPQDGADAETLLKNADAAMYRAKELGRNRFQFFTADVHERIRRRMELESSLRQALEREEFELHYQPQVSIKTGAIVGVEALLRWRHPQKGLVAPMQFIPFAEETGLIVPIGTWVLNRACAQNKSWQDAGLPRIPVSVNMSARQCEQDDIDQVVKKALEESGLEAKYLELEITESISMAHPDESVPLMTRLKETGVTLSIDDFGTGFSNLSYLRRFPVDRLKIDLSFVREIMTDPSSLAISEAIITMSHSLNLQVVAEGVETLGQLELLGARNCDSIQGFYFSPPVPGDELAQILREGRRLSNPPGIRVHPAPALLM
jgi:EAL domain-containing protein (putative c-di-GMP-specific phosphodiesterase class I)